MLQVKRCVKRTEVTAVNVTCPTLVSARTCNHSNNNNNHRSSNC